MAYIPSEFSRIAATDGEIDFAKAHGSDELCKLLSDSGFLQSTVSGRSEVSGI